MDTLIEGTDSMKRKKDKLNINTPKGQEALSYERAVIKAFCGQHSSIGWIGTSKNEPAVVDGLFYLNRDMTLYSICEVKVRDMTLKQLTGKYKNEWLVSNHKIVRGRRLGEMLCASLVGFLYLKPDGLLLVQKITDKTGDWAIPEPRVAVTTTPANVNGGIKEEENAFINMENAKEYKIEIKL